MSALFHQRVYSLSLSLKKNVAHPAANNSPRIMIRATIHCIALPTSCGGIVSRMFGYHPSARNGSTRFLIPVHRQPSRRACTPVFRAGRLFIIIIAIADLMSKPNATARQAVFFYYRSARALFFRGDDDDDAYAVPRVCATRIFISLCVVEILIL